MYLSEAQVGKGYTVKRIDLPFETERRLEALGMTGDAPVFVLNRKGKGILIIKLRGTRFALGYNITKNIEVEERAEGAAKDASETKEGTKNADETV